MSESAIHPKLAIERPDQPLEEFQLVKSPVVVGRVKSNDIVLKGDSAVSREHCRFEIDPDSGIVEVVDLGSSNGTFLNGTQVEKNSRRRLKPGDKVQVGATLMTFSVDRPSAGAIVRTVKQKFYNAPLPPKDGEEKATEFGEDYCTCGRCGNTIGTVGLVPGDKVGCLRCRAVWTIPARG
ncbi:MAG: FHA domain-containing protein [Planctomycetota bacterium]|nr:FHA domain-containing protein [Planctomycetota bacterium]